MGSEKDEIDGFEGWVNIDTRLLASLIAQNESSIYVIQDFRVVYANPSFSKLTGYSANELKEILFLDIVHPKDRKLVKLLFINDFAEIRKYSSNSFTLRLLTHFNEMRWVKTIFTIVEWECRWALLCSSYDITQQKEAEEAMATQEQNLSMLVNAFGDLVFIINNNYNIVQANNAALARLGYMEHELLLESFVKLHADSERGVALTNLMEVFDGERKLYVTEFVLKNGKPLPLEVRMIKGLRRRRDVVFVIARDISERIEAEREIRASEEKFARAFNAGAVMMSLSTLDKGVFIDVNRTFLEKLGLTREEVIGKCSRDLNVFRQIERRDELIERVKRQGKVENVEVEIQSTKGDCYTVLLSAEVINVQKTDCLLVAMSDITYRKQMEEELARSRAQLRGTLDNLPFIAWLMDTKRGYLLVNKNFLNYFGLNDEDVYNKPYAATWRDPILTQLNDREKEVVKTKQSVSWEAREGERGMEEWWEFHLNPVLSRTKKVIAITGIARRITEQKLNQIKLQKNLDRQILLTQVSYLFNTTIPFSEQLKQASNLIVSKIGLSKLFTIIGAPNDFQINICCSEKIASISADIDDFYRTNGDKILSYFQSESSRNIDISGSSMPGYNKLKKIAGGQYLLIFPIRVKGQCMGILGVDYPFGDKVKAADDREFLLTMINILSAAVESYQNEEQLRKAKEMAEQASRAKERFLSTMSHEIRTPMNAIIGMANLLIEEKPQKEQLDNLKSLKYAAENLLSLLNDILDFSKIEAGKIELIKASFDIEELTRGIHSTFLQMARNKGLELSYSIDPKLPTNLIGDRVRLNQILTNLVGNAIKFTEKGSVNIAIDCHEIIGHTARASFSVTDTGIGIPSEKLTDIFNEFTQAHEKVGTFSGTGLGLAISKRLVELMGGTIDIQSKVGEGSTFSFTLPFQIGHSNHEPQKPIGDVVIEPGNYRILIVEDNEMNTLIVKRFLTNWGVGFEHAANGKEALESVIKDSFDLILMDLEMPEMNGYEAAIAIRALADEKKSAIPIIALSASAMLDVQSKIFGIGMNDFLLKPFKPLELKAKIARYLNKKDEL